MGLVLPDTIQDPVTDDFITTAWGDGVNTAAAYLGRDRPHCRLVRASTNFTHNSTGNWLTVTFDAESFDVGANHSLVSNTSRITIVDAGCASFDCGGAWNTNGTGRRLFRIIKNGATIIKQVELAISSNESGGGVFSGPYACVAGDYFEMQAFQSSGGNLDLLYASDYSPVFSMMWESV